MISVDAPEKLIQEQESPLRLRKRTSNLSSPISQCLVTQMSTPWFVESLRSRSTTQNRYLVHQVYYYTCNWLSILSLPLQSLNSMGTPSTRGSRRESRVSSRMSYPETSNPFFGTRSSKPATSSRTLQPPWRGGIDGWRHLSSKISIKRLTTITRRKTNRKTHKKRNDYRTRFSITEPVPDLSVIQTLLMPKYHNETGPNVRKWLSDSNVKYIHENGPYETNLIKTLLDSNGMPQVLSYIYFSIQFISIF